jgi:sugar (pentulose or hexulose) kinase
MSCPDLILSIDCGTQSLKGMVFDGEGNLVAVEKTRFPLYDSPQPGWAEQDPEVFWQALCRTCRALWHQGVKADRIAGVGLTGQRGTVVNVDSSGNPVRPAIIWLDQRRTLHQRFIPGPWGLLFRLAGLRETIAYFQSEAEANWIFAYQPDIWRATYKYLLLTGFLSYRLVGEFVDSIGCQVGYLPFDFKRFRWAHRWNWKWLCLPIDPSLLPELVMPATSLGRITASASEQTGIPKGLPLIAAAADKACEVLGSGSFDPSIGCLSYGTTATINVTHERYIEAIRLLPPYPSAVPGRYTLEVQIYRGYWMVSWFKEEFGYPEMQMAMENHQAPEELFEKLVQSVPPGSMGLMLQPYWSPGLKLPGPEAKGAVIGFGDVHSRAHLYRSILEGLAYALREGKERIEKKTRIPITGLRVSGGGSQSSSAMQLTADIFGLPAARPMLYETSGLGAAMVVAVGLGLHRDFETAVHRMTRIGSVFEPNMQAHAVYDELYRHVYQKMYAKLKPLYRRIRKITGYPA